ncbi:MAG: hypothetical protein HY711_10055 [Candidatus Melainabacteria bacterium]|nr:hypothetical protein [Candidatus Melainabacteria bacterium]
MSANQTPNSIECIGNVFYGMRPLSSCLNHGLMVLANCCWTHMSFTISELLRRKNVRRGT